MFDQRGAESHWDVMERLVLCGRREGAEGGRQRDGLNESFEKWGPRAVRCLLRGVLSQNKHTCRRIRTARTSLSSLSLFTPLSLSLRGSAFEAECNL